jgi:NADPH-dependent 2,4-dienoyl-CoA reductase/sulfur reductase-like enzyme
MPSYNYLIIGAGMTADAAVRGIRECDRKGTIGIIGEGLHPPYARPPLSKKLWQGKPQDSIWCGTEAFGITLHLGRRADALDVETRRIRDDIGGIYHYDKLLLATGGTPRRLPFGGDEPIYFRSLDDYRRLRGLAGERRRFAVIGGGFIGAEIAAALTMNGREVTMLFPEKIIGSRLFPADLGNFVTDYYRGKGVEVREGCVVTGIVRDGDLLVVTTRDGWEAGFDGVVVGIGIEPNVALAAQAGLMIDNGVVVDDLLSAGRPDIFAAGDVASFYNPLLGVRIRLEHEDAAVSMGHQAGRNMAGAGEPFRYLPSFYSDLFDLGFEAVGEIDGRLETFAAWKVPFREGVVYYLREDLIRGVLLWNVWDKVPAARELINTPLDRQAPGL